MQAERDIQKLHDVLHAFVSGEVQVGQTSCQVAQARTMLAVLGWVLEHDCGQRFGETMTTLMQRIDDAGYRLNSIAVPLTGRPGRG